MPRIIEARRRGAGGGMTGIRSGYQRIGNQDKPYWPEPPPAGEQQQKEGHDLSTTAPKQHGSLLTRDADNEQAVIEAAKAAFQNRKPRKKKRTWLSAKGELEDEIVAFGSKPKPKQPSLVTPRASVNNPEKPSFPLVTPAASVLSLVDHANVHPQGSQSQSEQSTNASLLAWQESPQPHAPAPTSVEAMHQKEVEALKECHRLELEEHLRKYIVMEQELKSEIQLWKDKVQERDDTINDLVKNIELSDKKKDEYREECVKKAVDDERKIKDELHANAMEDAIRALEQQHRVSIKIKEEESAKALQEAVELERTRVEFLWEEDKRNHHLELSSLQLQLEASKKEREAVDGSISTAAEAGLRSFMAQQQMEKFGSLEEVCTFLSKIGLMSTPLRVNRVPNLPMVERFTYLPQHLASVQSEIDSSLVSNPFRSSDRTYGLSYKNQTVRIQTGGSECNSIPIGTTPFRSSGRSFELSQEKHYEHMHRCTAASGLLDLKNKVASEGTADTTHGQEPATCAAKCEANGTVEDVFKSVCDRKCINQGSPYEPLVLAKVPRSKASPLRKASDLKAPAIRASPRKRLLDFLPSFQLPSNLESRRDPKRHKRNKGRE